jgi:branched-chain amino acid transport system substrate-binding protein
VVILAVIGLFAPVVTACSSSGSSSGSGSSADSSPINLGIITDVDTAGTDHSDVLAAAKGAVRAVNKAGGVNGHPLKLLFCNENLEPNQAEACVRQMVSGHVAAMVGNTIYTAEQYADETFRAAGIAQLGNTADGISEHDPNSYMLDGGQTFANGGQIYGASTLAGKRIAYVGIALPFTAPYLAFYRKACVSLGCQIVSTATVPSETATDFAPEAAALMQGKPQVVVVDVGLGIIPLLRTMDQLGYTGKVVIQDANFTTKNFFAQACAQQRQFVLQSTYPPPFLAANDPGLKEYTKDMQAEKAAGDSAAPDYTKFFDSFDMNAYLAVKAFAEVASTAHAYDAASFKKAINAARNIDILGLKPPWNPNDSLFAQLPRVNRDQYFYYTTNSCSSPAPKVLGSTTTGAVTKVVKAAY